MYQSDQPKYTTFEIDKVQTVLQSIPLEQLKRGPWQQRRYFDESKLDELADSMRAAGTNVVPIIVAPHYEGGFSIVAGERRWRAAQKIGHDKLSCLVGKYSYEQAAFICAVENLQREDINPIEEASSYLALQDQLNFSHEMIAKQIGKSRSHVTNYLRLLKLDIQVRDALVRGRLTYGQARPLCTLDSPAQQRRIAENTMRYEWPVIRVAKEVEALTRKPNTPVRLSDTDADLRRLERAISETTGLDCIIKRSPKGQWQLGFNAPSSEIFLGLLERLGVETDADLEN